MKITALCGRIKAKIRTTLNVYIRKHFIMPKQKKRLQTRQFSIIASNCNGGVLTHDLGVRFNSPTINLWMNAEDYIEFCEHLDEYLSADIIQIYEDGISYPLGLLAGRIKLYFQHYSDFNCAKEKWIERCKRVNKQELFFMMTDRNGCTDEIVERFEKLPYKNKLIFTSRDYSGCKSVVVCPEFKKDRCVGIMSDFRSWNGERIYDRYFDPVAWLNEGVQ